MISRKDIKRYPGESADRPEAVLAVKTMKRCRLEIR
jgi:hypothetical protein